MLIKYYEKKKTLSTLWDIWANLNQLHPRMLCYKFGWNWPMQCFWRRRFLNFMNVFSLFRKYLPLGKGGAFHMNKLESSSPKNALCQVCLIMAQWFWRKRFLKFVKLMYFRYFVIIYPLRMHFAKFGWNRPRGSWKKFFKFRQIIFSIS